VLESKGNGADVSAKATDVQTGATQKRGRPRGSKNKITRDAKEVLSKHGLKGIETLCRIAGGNYVLGPPDKDGRREKMYPTLKEVLDAAKAVASWQLPTLRAVEQKIDAVVADVTEPVDDIDLTKAVVHLLSKANTSERLTTVGSNDVVVRSDAASKFLPDAAAAAGSSPIPEALNGSAAAEADPSNGEEAASPGFAASSSLPPVTVPTGADPATYGQDVGPRKITLPPGSTFGGGPPEPAPEPAPPKPPQVGDVIEVGTKGTRIQLMERQSMRGDRWLIFDRNDVPIRGGWWDQERTRKIAEIWDETGQIVPDPSNYKPADIIDNHRRDNS
jgi:hypothetical protein